LSKKLRIFAAKKIILKNMKKLLYISLLVILCTSCQTSKKTVAVDKNTDQVTMKVGETCEIEFVTNASTGYWWQWTNKPATSIVDSVSDRYVNNAPKGMVGAPCKRYWKFKAVSKGTQTLTFMYARADLSEAVKTRNVVITVQ